MSGTATAEQFKIVSIEMTADRFAQQTPLKFAGDGVPNPIAVELNIFENITLPYLTGSLVLLDDGDLYRRLNIQGTERILVRYKPKDLTTGLSGNDTEVEKTFYIVNIKKATKHNDYTSVMFINLIEDIGYFDKIQTFSKSYSGKGEEIIEKIVREKLNRELDTQLMKETYQKPFRYIVPYESPLKACNTILSKITTENGAPYFLFSTVSDNKFILCDLESIVAEDAFNKDKPFIYSQKQTNDPDDNFLSQVYNAYNFDGSNLDDTLKLAQTGGVSVKYGYFNTSKSEEFDTTVNMYQKIQDLINRSALPNDQKNIQIDVAFRPDPSGGGDNITQYQPRYLYQVSSSPYPLSDNILGFSEEDTKSDYVLRVVKHGLLKHLTKNIFTLNLPGFTFNTSSKKTTVGRPIEITVFKNQVVDPNAGKTTNTVDEKRSGKYIILSKRHLFNITNESHIVSVEVGRVANPEVQR